MARLTWTDNSHNETGFTVERRAAGSTTWTSGTTVGADVEVVFEATANGQKVPEWRVVAQER